MPSKQKTTSKKKENHNAALFIPAGLLLGMGFGFLFKDLVAGLFIGLGGGMVIFAVLNFIQK